MRDTLHKSVVVAACYMYTIVACVMYSMWLAILAYMY